MPEKTNKPFSSFRFDQVKDQTKTNYFSLMPGEGAFLKVFADAFIINEPLAAVGRNGYWLHERDDAVFLAIFACAGRGHLASMMTRIYASSLKRLVVDHNILFPGSILGFIHREIKSRFKNRENFILHTGSDLGILKFDKKSKKVEFAGANIDLLYLNGENINVIKGDQLPIGPESDGRASFHTQTLENMAGKTLYLQTEGLKSLVVGTAFKALGHKGVLTLLNKVRDKSFNDQYTLLSNYVKKWSVATRKTDDILLIGLKF